MNLRSPGKRPLFFVLSFVFLGDFDVGAFFPDASRARGEYSCAIDLALPFQSACFPHNPSYSGGTRADSSTTLPFFFGDFEGDSAFFSGDVDAFFDVFFLFLRASSAPPALPPSERASSEEL